MRNVRDFWWMCAKAAFWGNSSFANDWQWVFGNPLASLIGVVIAAYRGANALTTGSDVLDAFVVAAFAFVVTWVVAFLIRFFSLPSKYFFAEKERAEYLHQKSLPKVTISYDEFAPQCRSVSRFTDEAGNVLGDGMCFRLKVVNSGSKAADSCEGFLTEVCFEGETPELAPMNLIWVTQPPMMVTDIKMGVDRYLDIVVIGENGEVALRSHGWPPNNKRDFFERTGAYLFKVVISARDSVTTAPYRFRLIYDGNWQTSKIEVL